MHTQMQTSIDICIAMHIYVYMYVYIYIHSFILYLYIDICISNIHIWLICIWTICTYVSIYVIISINVYINSYIYIYIHIYIHIHSSLIKHICIYIYKCVCVCYVIHWNCECIKTMWMADPIALLTLWRSNRSAMMISLTKFWISPAEIGDWSVMKIYENEQSSTVNQHVGKTIMNPSHHHK